MTKYKLLPEGVVLNQETGASFLLSSDNRHVHEYQEWLKAGNEPLPMDESIPESPKVELPSPGDVDKITTVAGLKAVVKLLVERLA